MTALSAKQTSTHFNGTSASDIHGAPLGDVIEIVFTANTRAVFSQRAAPTECWPVTPLGGTESLHEVSHGTTEMKGGCYCGALRYCAGGKPLMKAQCHCRECQYISGGGPNFYMVMPHDGFAYTQGAPRTFQRADLDQPVTREFCEICGTHILTRRHDTPHIILKIGTLDDPAQGYGQSRLAIYTVDKQDWQIIPEGMPCFEGLPPRR